MLCRFPLCGEVSLVHDTTRPMGDVLQILWVLWDAGCSLSESDLFVYGCSDWDVGKLKALSLLCAVAVKCYGAFLSWPVLTFFSVTGQPFLPTGDISEPCVHLILRLVYCYNIDDQCQCGVNYMADWCRREFLTMMGFNLKRNIK